MLGDSDSDAQLDEVGLSYLIKINSAQLNSINDIQYFLHWVSFNIHQQHLLLQYSQYSTIARSLSFASGGEDSCWSVCLSCLSILSPLYVRLAALQFWI